MLTSGSGDPSGPSSATILSLSRTITSSSSHLGTLHHDVEEVLDETMPLP